MSAIADLFNNGDVISAIAGGLSVILVWLISKLPAKVKSIFVKTIDKTDAELDKENTPKV